MNPDDEEGQGKIDPFMARTLVLVGIFAAGFWAVAFMLVRRIFGWT